MFYFFRRKRATEPFEPVVVQNCWPTKKARMVGRTTARIVQTEDVPSNSVLDAAVQTEAILDAAVQTEAILDAAVQTEDVIQTEDVVQTEDLIQTELNLACVEVSSPTDAVQTEEEELVVRRVLYGVPSPSDSKKTKSMSVLCGVPALSSGKKRKSSAKKKLV